MFVIMLWRSFIIFQLFYSLVENSNYCNNFQCHETTCESVFCTKTEPNALYCNCCSKCSEKTDQDSSKCQNEQTLRKNLISSDNDISEDLWIPNCNNNGEYDVKQIKRKKSFCMSPDGMKLFGISMSSSPMQCKCSQHINKLKVKKKSSFLIKPEEHCNSIGDFEKLQCIGNICYCASEKDGSLEGRMVLKNHINKLPCYAENTYLKSCEKELIRLRNITYHFELKGIEVIGIKSIECDPDGTFAPKQCHPNRCSCTNKDGVELGSFYTDNHTVFLQMSCGCARDKEANMQCNPYGNYRWSQCLAKEQCFCVDEDGDIITKSFSETNDEFCKAKNRELKQST